MRSEGLPEVRVTWHTCRELYRPGETIGGGRWGRIVLATGSAHPAWEREQLLEQVRNDVAGAAPSRLASAFAHAELAAARSYAAPDEQIYQVELTDVSVTLDMLWVTWIRESLSSGDRTRAERQAAHYWGGQSARNYLPAATPHWEVLTPGDLLVVAAVKRVEE